MCAAAERCRGCLLVVVWCTVSSDEGQDRKVVAGARRRQAVVAEFEFKSLLYRLKASEARRKWSIKV